MRPCKLCGDDLDVHKGDGRVRLRDDAHRATVLLTNGHTTTVTICERCVSALPQSLTALRRNCNAALAVERDNFAAQGREDSAHRDAADTRHVHLGYLHVFGAERWRDINDKVRVRL